jgi:hypothetical protein
MMISEGQFQRFWKQIDEDAEVCDPQNLNQWAEDVLNPPCKAVCVFKASRRRAGEALLGAERWVLLANTIVVPIAFTSLAFRPKSAC